MKKYIIILFSGLFIACSKEKPKDSPQEIITIKNGKLIYPKEKTVLLFTDNSFKSNEQKKILTRLNIKFYEINSSKIKNFFKIRYYPTIIILDKNRTIKYEKFIPYEMISIEKNIKD